MIDSSPAVSRRLLLLGGPAAQERQAEAPAESSAGIPKGFGQRWARLIASVALLCALCLLVLPAAARANGGTVKFIGVRGSGDQTSPLGGNLLTTVAVKLLKRLPAGTDWHAVGLDYPACAMDGWLITGSYMRSEGDGVTKLRDLIRAEFANGANPNEQIVLAGYSQGANVVGDVLSNGRNSDDRLTDSELSHIKAVLIFADPRFNSNESFDRGSYVVGRNGLLDTRSMHDLDRADSNDQIRSYARKDDIVCQGSGNWDEHNQDKYLADYGDNAAAFAFSKLGFPKPPTSVYGGKLDVAFVIDTTGSMGAQSTP